MIEGLFGFVMAGLALAGSPGPATLSLAATGAAFGSRNGLSYMTGINIGMLVVLVITASGVTGVVLAIPGATPVIAVLSAALVDERVNVFLIMDTSIDPADHGPIPTG